MQDLGSEWDKWYLGESHMGLHIDSNGFGTLDSYYEESLMLFWSVLGLTSDENRL